MKRGGLKLLMPCIAMNVRRNCGIYCSQRGVGVTLRERVRGAGVIIITLSPEPRYPHLHSTLHPILSPFTMQAIRLQKKYPEVSQDEMFDLINRFKCVLLSPVGFRCDNDNDGVHPAPALFTPTSRGA